MKTDSYEWINGQKPHLIKNGIRAQWNTDNFVPIVGSRLVSEFILRFLSVIFKDTFQTGESLLNIFFQLVFFTNDNIKW